MTAQDRRFVSHPVNRARRWFWRASWRMSARASQLSQAYCRAVVRRSLESGPIGEPDFFWNLGPAR
ncbi:MAG TPA: hypothetical protein VNR00_14775 [Opitutus sp.]|nr:hypothetical protein [Opitutus sp.]